MRSNLVPPVGDRKGSDLLRGVFLIFLTLQLCDVITWSWWWITAPIWGDILLKECAKRVKSIIVTLERMVTETRKDTE